MGILLTAPCDTRLEPALVLQPDIIVVPVGCLGAKSATVTVTPAIEVITASALCAAGA